MTDIRLWTNSILIFIILILAFAYFILCISSDSNSLALVSLGIFLFKSLKQNQPLIHKIHKTQLIQFHPQHRSMRIDFWKANQNVLIKSCKNSFSQFSVVHSSQSPLSCPLLCTSINTFVFYTMTMIWNKLWLTQKCVYFKTPSSSPV